ncbi:MAG: DUF4266 domain-containing protein [Myxococcales bacterium]|nr:DUF4266 domain-containing protein [Myxococcales bacterium]MCB9578750.1 DUF4266 domain-containing protein [Polyangiaceae bacterium]
MRGHSLITRAFLLALVSSAALAVGCAEVAPYQRGRLAQPSMSPDDNESVSRDHMQAVHEGAAGGNVAPSSGCGCN